MTDSSHKNLSVIDRGLIVKGEINSNGSLIIKGRLEGMLNGETVVIAEDGQLAATANVANMTIAGSFEGEVNVTRELSILATGTCSGIVTCGTLTVEKGGILNARINSPESAADKNGFGHLFTVS